MADAIQAEVGYEVELIKGGGGEFIVTAGDTQIFSKKEVGRFPEHDEILAALRA